MSIALVCRVHGTFWEDVNAERVNDVDWSVVCKALAYDYPDVDPGRCPLCDRSLVTAASRDSLAG